MSQMKFYTEATYRGRGGYFDSDDAAQTFSFGAGYQLEVMQVWFGQLVIHAIHPVTGQQLDGTRVKYPSLFAFFMDWQIGRVWRGSYLP